MTILGLQHRREFENIMLPLVLYFLFFIIKNLRIQELLLLGQTYFSNSPILDLN